MSRSACYLTFEGQFESGVLGMFRIFHGFANLKTLAEISVWCQMAPSSFPSRWRMWSTTAKSTGDLKTSRLGCTNNVPINNE